MRTTWVKSIELKYYFQAMKEEQLSNYKYLSNSILNDIGVRLTISKLCIKKSEIASFGGMRSKQYPDELAKLLVFLYEHRKDINSYCEIGTERGGTFFIIDSFLRAVNPDMGKSCSIDFYMNHRRMKLIEIYKKENPQIEFVQTYSNKFIPDQNYDFCFIDGSHKYEEVKQDYEKMLRYSKFIALHDIRCHLPHVEVYRLWDDIKGDKIELLNEDSRFCKVPMGIGVIVNDQQGSG